MQKEYRWFGEIKTMPLAWVAPHRFGEQVTTLSVEVTTEKKLSFALVGIDICG